MIVSRDVRSRVGKFILILVLGMTSWLAVQIFRPREPLEYQEVGLIVADGRLIPERIQLSWSRPARLHLANVSGTPQVTVVMAAAGPALLASIYFFGWRSLAMVILSYTIGIVIELVVAIFKNEEVTEGMFVTCILFPLILPPTLPFWMAAVGIAVGIIIGKEIFGGTGKNIFNPAIVGRTFIAITFPVQMASQWVPPFRGGLGGFVHWSQSADVITTATPLGNFKNGMPDGLWDMFIGATSGSFGETSAVLIIAGGLFLISTKVANWRLPAATNGSAMALA